VRNVAIAAAAASVLLADAAIAGPFAEFTSNHVAIAEKAHWLRKPWSGYSGPPLGIEYTRNYSYAFESSYYQSGYAGCVGVQHMCASRWGWASSNFRRCLSKHRWC
jgi:hypothetical protein